MTHGKRLRTICALVLALAGGCNRTDPDRVQGYVEGEFVYVACPSGGSLESLYVRRGAQVKAGDLLFALDDTPERAAREQAERQAAQARATWEDLKKAKRPSEIESAQAQLEQARAAWVASDKELKRQESLYRSQSTSAQDLERARAARDQDRQKVDQMEADLQTARMPARSDQIIAAEATLKAQEAALKKAEWDLAQKRQSAQQAALVFDTLFREGEWVAAGKPVVALLPPPNIKVRAFVPQTRIGALTVGQDVRVSVDGVAEPFAGKISFISPRAEYTPPVIYSQESRSKLVFMIEAIFEPALAARLHPGQPVDVYFGP